MGAYTKKVQIESRTLGYLSSNHIIPAALQYQNTLIKNVQGLKDLGLKKDSYSMQLKFIELISKHIHEISEHVADMINARKKANKISDTQERALAYCHEVKSKFEKIRYHVDKLELIVDNNLWPMPKYRELLFLK